jgi:hypothetical protein
MPSNEFGMLAPNHSNSFNHHQAFPNRILVVSPIWDKMRTAVASMRREFYHLGEQATEHEYEKKSILFLIVK